MKIVEIPSTSIKSFNYGVGGPPHLSGSLAFILEASRSLLGYYPCCSEMHPRSPNNREFGLECYPCSLFYESLPFSLGVSTV